MDYNRYRNDMKKQMEDEMSRFEQEISRTTYPQPVAQIQAKPLPAMFIPPQIQRQQNRAQTSSSSFIIQSNQLTNAVLPMHGNYANRIPIAENQNMSILPQNRFPIMLPTQSFTSLNTSGQSSALKPAPSYTVTPMGLPTNVHNVPNYTPSTTTTTTKKSKSNDSKNKKQKKALRVAGGQTWEDPSLQEWGQDDFRIFCGDLGNDVNDEILSRAFNKYPSFIKCKVIRDKKTNKSKGYGFISFKDPTDFIKAMRDMDGKYVGSRPIKLRKSNWKDRNLDVVKKKLKEKQKLGLI